MAEYPAVGLPAVAADEDELFVVEGVIGELQVASGKENLLQRLDKHYKGKAGFTGAGAIAGGMYGQVANAAMVAMYDGEYTENFICLIDGKVMCGTFGGASKLPVGHKVRAVVRKRGDLFVAEGILSEDKGLAWLAHAWGWKAERAANFKIAWGAYAFGMVGMILVGGLVMGFGNDDFWDFIQITSIAGAVILFGMALWNSSTMNALADPATEVFRKLGFANPESINLNSYRYGIVHGHELLKTDEIEANHFNIHCYKKAIEDGKLKMVSDPGD